VCVGGHTFPRGARARPRGCSTTGGLWHGTKNDAVVSSRTQFLAVLDEQTRRDVRRSARRRRYERHERLFHEGDPSDGMHLVDLGWIAIRSSTPAGDVATLAIIGPGEPVGEQSLIATGATRSATAFALTAVESLYLGRDAFDDLRARHPSVDRFLATLLEDRLRRVSERLTEALYVPAPERVLRRLLDAAESLGDRPVPLTQLDLASLAGTTRPTVNRILRSAEHAGAIVLHRGDIEVVDRVLLGRLARTRRT